MDPACPEDLIDLLRHYTNRMIDAVTLIYEPMALASRTTALQHDLCATYQQAFACYSQRRWREARQVLEASTACRRDGPSLRLLERCAALERSPPAQSWDGVYDLEFK